MGLTKVQTLILFTLGRWYEEASRAIQGQPLDLAITKAVFIKALVRAGIAHKGERALYQNLEDLEKKKLVAYENKCLSLTERGRKRYSLVLKELEPYLSVIEVLQAKNPLTQARQVQTRIAVK